MVEGAERRFTKNRRLKSGGVDEYKTWEWAACLGLQHSSPSLPAELPASTHSPFRLIGFLVPQLFSRKQPATETLVDMFPKALLVIATLAIAVAAAPKGGKGGNGQVSCKHGRKSANAAVGGDFPLTRWNDADEHPHTGSAVSGWTSWTTSRRTCSTTLAVVRMCTSLFA